MAPVTRVRFSHLAPNGRFVCLIILGKSVIEAWVGIKYVEPSYPVLLLMLLPSTLMMAQSASSRVLFGMAQHQTLAIVTLLEGIVNVALSIILVRPYGIVGDAVGTAIPLTATMVLFMPAHVCHKLQIPVRTFVREAYVLPLVVCAPLVLTLLLMKSWFVPHTYAQLGMHFAVAGLVYGGGMWWIVASKKATKMGPLHMQEIGLESVAEISVETCVQDI